MTNLTLFLGVDLVGSWVNFTDTDSDTSEINVSHVSLFS
jgi:hypothetical protein